MRESNWGVIILIIIIVLVIIGALFYAYQPSAPESSTSNGSNSATSSETVSTIVVSYTDAGFSPKSVTIKKGDTVTFENSSSKDMWVASDPHPLHNGYPTKGGCVSSTFDACGNAKPGQSWSFVFDISGNWGYHNHLNPSEEGTVVVQ